MTSKGVVFMFSGQGSQYYHMGKDLYLRHPGFKNRMDDLDRIAMDLIGESVIQRLYDDKKKISENFDRIRYSHPAIFMVEYSLSRVLAEQGIEPDAVLGSSLGEFAAAAVSGVISPGDALEMVIKQAEMIETSCPEGEGGMLTILHDPSLYDENSLLHHHTELAAINYPTHFVISGSRQALREIEKFLKIKNITSQLLPVTYAFHSSSMDPVKSAYCSYLREKHFRRPAFTLVSGLTGKGIDEIPGDYFWQVVRQPMIFPGALKYLEETHDSHCLYLDLGPSGTLSNFVKNNLPGNSMSTYFSVISPFGSDLARLEQLNNSGSFIRPFQTKKENKKMKVFMFPGQGSQHKGMGAKLFDQYSDLVRKADEILGYSIKKLCLEDPDDQLIQTQFTQPAVYIVNYLHYLEKLRDNPPPGYVLGHSVAEYNALLASGVVDFETGLKLVKKRGELMAQAQGGGMAAVMGLTAEGISGILQQNKLENLYIANYNSPYQLVISGLKEDIEKAEPLFLKNGASHYKILKVSGAFHTPYMENAKKQFEKYVKKFKFSNFTIPVISNITARPYRKEQIMENIIEQITHPVNWTESIRYLLAKGADIDAFDEIGAGGLSIVKALAVRTSYEAEPLDISGEELDRSTEEKEKSAKKEEEHHQAATKTTEVNQPGAKSVEKLNILEKISGKLKKKKVEVEAAEIPNALAITAEDLGSKEFKAEYNLKYAYVAGGMYRGIASKALVVKMAKAGMLGFFGTGGLGLGEIEDAVRGIQKELNDGQPYGMNLVFNPNDLESEEKIIDLFLKYRISKLEAAAYMQMTSALVRYRAKGLRALPNGEIEAKNKIMAKISRPEIAEKFLSPAPQRILEKLLAEGKISPQEAEWAAKVPMADDLCVEADSGGHTDQGVAYALMPAMLKLRDEMMEKYAYPKMIRVGAAGGIGTPEAGAAAFILGADFILTGSINQCCVEAGTSDTVKNLLQQINVQDTDYAPAGDMFELGAKVQVLKRGVFFPARANKLYDLYRQFNSLEEIDEKTKKQIQERYFRKSFEEVFREVKSFYPQQEIEKAEHNPKHKMSLVFKWYFGNGTRLALSGDEEYKVDYQVQCGPALGAFNQWVKGTALEDWRNRHVDEIAGKIMQETAETLNNRFHSLIKNRSANSPV